MPKADWRRRLEFVGWGEQIAQHIYCEEWQGLVVLSR